MLILYRKYLPGYPWAFVTVSSNCPCAVPQDRGKLSDLSQWKWCTDPWHAEKSLYRISRPRKIQLHLSQLHAGHILGHAAAFSRKWYWIHPYKGQHRKFCNWNPQLPEPSLPERYLTWSCEAFWLQHFPLQYLIKESPEHFMRTFKKTYRMTPGETGRRTGNKRSQDLIYFLYNRYRSGRYLSYPPL